MSSFTRSYTVETKDCTWIPADVFLVLPLGLSDEGRHHSTVKVLATKVRVAGRRLDLKDPVVNC